MLFIVEFGCGFGYGLLCSEFSLFWFWLVSSFVMICVVVCCGLGGCLFSDFCCFCVCFGCVLVCLMFVLAFGVLFWGCMFV